MARVNVLRALVCLWIGAGLGSIDRAGLAAGECAKDEIVDQCLEPGAYSTTVDGTSVLTLEVLARDAAGKVTRLLLDGLHHTCGNGVCRRSGGESSGMLVQLSGVAFARQLSSGGRTFLTNYFKKGHPPTNRADAIVRPGTYLQDDGRSECMVSLAVHYVTPTRLSHLVVRPVQRCDFRAISLKCQNEESCVSQDGTPAWTRMVELRGLEEFQLQTDPASAQSRRLFRFQERP